MEENQNIEYKESWRDDYLAAGFIESWGRGIEKICSGFKNAKINIPIFEATQGGVRVTFNRNTSFRSQDDRKDDRKELSDKQRTILQLIKQNDRIKISEMTVKMQLSDKSVRRYLSDLKQQGIITREGGRKDGRWVIL